MTELSLSAYLRPELPPEALYGLPGDITGHIAGDGNVDPAVVLLSTLTMIGNAAGPQPHAWFGVAEHPGRLFTVIVGDPATGKKGTAVGAVERLFEEADPNWHKHRIERGLKSPEALINRVSNESDECDPRALIVEVELARLASKMGTFSPILRAAWADNSRGLGRSRMPTKNSDAYEHRDVARACRPVSPGRLRSP